MHLISVRGRGSRQPGNDRRRAGRAGAPALLRLPAAAVLPRGRPRDRARDHRRGLHADELGLRDVAELREHRLADHLRRRDRGLDDVRDHHRRDRPLCRLDRRRQRRRLRADAQGRASDVGGDPRHARRRLRARGGERDPQRPAPRADDHHHARDAQRLPRPRGPARERLSDLGLPRHRLVLGHRPEAALRPRPVRPHRADRLRRDQRLHAQADVDRPPRLRDGQQPAGCRARRPPRQPDPDRRAHVQRASPPRSARCSPSRRRRPRIPTSAPATSWT